MLLEKSQLLRHDERRAVREREITYAERTANGVFGFAHEWPGFSFERSV